MDWHHVSGPDEVVAEEQLARTGVARHVHKCVTPVDNMCSELAEPVDHSVHRALVARDQRAGEHYRVTGFERYHRVGSVGHPRKRRQRLTLRSSRNDHDILGPVIVNIPQIDQSVGRHVQIAKLASDSHVADHRTSDVDHLPAVRHGGVHHLLYAVNMRGEARHDDALPTSREDSVQSRGDIPFGCDETRYFRIG
jgi:hypothetical protein